MKTNNFLSGFKPGWTWGLFMLLSLSLSGCYTVLKNSSDYYSEFDTSDKKKEVIQDTLIVQTEYESESGEYADTTEFEDAQAEEASGSKTVIINHYYDDPWGWNYYNPYYPNYGWRVSIGWGAYYYDPYYYNPYWHSGYYWGWYHPPVYYDPWYYHHNWYGGGSGGGYSHYQRRDYGMRRYQLNPVTPGGSGVFTSGGSRSTTTGAVSTTGGGQGRTYRDNGTTGTVSRDEGSRVEKSGKGSQRKYRSGDKIKPGPTGTKEKSGRNEGRKFKDNDNQKRDNDNSSRSTRTERNSGSGSGSQTRDSNSGGGGRDYNSGSSGQSGRSGGNDGGSRGSSGGGRDYNRPTRK